jgi:hypothetical protein
MIDLVELFCHVDDFCQRFMPAYEKTLLEQQVKHHKTRQCSLSSSEIMTIILYFYHSNYRDFKHYYLNHVCYHLKKDFPHLVSYNRFIELKRRVVIPMCAYLQSRQYPSSEINFVDSTCIKVCHNRRIARHKTFSNIAQRSKTSVDWFYSFKLHLIINDEGELINCFISAGNLDDRKGLLKMAKGLNGNVFADKGYLSKQLSETLQQQNVKLVTRVRKNMTPPNHSPFEKLLLRKRALIETVIGQLKDIYQLEHTKHRCLTGLITHLLGVLIAYTWQFLKPSLRLRKYSSSLTSSLTSS